MKDDYCSGGQLDHDIAMYEDYVLEQAMDRRAERICEDKQTTAIRALEVGNMITTTEGDLVQITGIDVDSLMIQVDNNVNKYLIHIDNVLEVTA